MAEHPVDPTAGQVVGTIIDMSGVLRAKAMPADRLASFVKTGAGAAPSWNVFCADDALALTDTYSVVGDLRLRVSRDTLRDIGGGILWSPASFCELSGEPSPTCTRSALATLTERLACDGYEALVGHEIEFVLSTTGEKDEWRAYGLAPLLRSRAFWKTFLDAAATAGLPVEQYHAEAGPGQFELSLSPAAPVEAADNMVLARILVCQAARACGMRASFSPVPFPGAASNGAHEHVSLTKDGAPVFGGGDEPHGLTATGGSAIAGLVRYLPEFLLVLAGSPLSPLRLRPGMWSGAFSCWGLENRECAVRLCAATPGSPAGANVEVKTVDPSANPYLGTTAILTMLARGMKEGLPLPQEVTADPASLTERERVAASVARLPADVPAAIERFTSSALVRAAFPREIFEAIVAVRRSETDRLGSLSAPELAELLRYSWTA
jgi:glutamine synthetase